MDLVANLIKQGWLRSEIIIEAFKKIKRKDFLPPGLESLADYDDALPIGYEQTISQPLVVAFMLELLQPRAGERILDIGSGSGWTTTLLSYVVSRKLESIDKGKGQVIAMEIIPQLVNQGRDNVAKYNFVEKGIAQFICGDGRQGYPNKAPFDKILSSASLKKEKDILKTLPLAWKKQLKIGGRLVTPIDQSIWLFLKRDQEKWQTQEYPGFVFVPLVDG